MTPGISDFHLYLLTISLIDAFDGMMPSPYYFMHLVENNKLIQLGVIAEVAARN
jgi:hypothetical protein